MNRKRPAYTNKIVVTKTESGVLNITIPTRIYGLTGKHWKEQLTGRNRRKWGKIRIDPSRAESDMRRSLAMCDYGTLPDGSIDWERDECPGAMFICEKRIVSHVQACDKWSNRALGRDLYNAIAEFLFEEKRPPENRVRRKMGWWQVNFRFT